MKFGATIFLVPLLLAAAIIIRPLIATEIPQAERRSGYTFMGPETKAMQDDDTANPGMLGTLDGEALWNRKAGAATKACADCHGDARSSMKGVAARYPAYDKPLGRPVNLEQRINLCRARHQEADPLAYEKHDLLALTAYRRGTVARHADRARYDAGAPAVRGQRTRFLHAPAGAAQSWLHQLS